VSRSEKTRAAIYALAAAVFLILSVYGLASQEQIGAWLGLVAAAIPVLALYNVPGFRPSKGDTDTPESPYSPKRTGILYRPCYGK
jgi:hypothetical protein